jgi:hypothetical protein
MLAALVIVQGCELLDSADSGSKCSDTKLDKTVYEKFQLVLQIPDYAQVSDLHPLSNAYKIELIASMKPYDCANTQTTKTPAIYENESLYVKANWSFQNQFFNVGIPKSWYINNERDYFKVIIEATAYFDDGTWYLNQTFKSDTYSGIELNNPGKVIVMLGYDPWVQH